MTVHPSPSSYLTVHFFGGAEGLDFSLEGLQIFGFSRKQNLDFPSAKYQLKTS